MNRDATETMSWLQEAIAAGNGKQILAMAMKDPDLEPLRAEIAKLGKRS
jgi:hypothetical protein